MESQREENSGGKSPDLAQGGAGLSGRREGPALSNDGCLNRSTLPIWIAALIASHCQAKGDKDRHTVRWQCAESSALYTNAGSQTEHIEPFGVSLESGHSLAVWWVPGETAYKTEVIRQSPALSLDFRPLET